MGIVAGYGKHCINCINGSGSGRILTGIGGISALGGKKRGYHGLRRTAFCSTLGFDRILRSTEIHPWFCRNVDLSPRNQEKKLLRKVINFPSFRCRVKTVSLFAGDRLT
jgi:hypothetical protein